MIVYSIKINDVVEVAKKTIQSEYEEAVDSYYAVITTEKNKVSTYVKDRQEELNTTLMQSTLVQHVNDIITKYNNTHGHKKI